MARFYQCPNIGNCDKADSFDIIRFPKGTPTSCPICGSHLNRAKVTGTLLSKLAIVIGLLLFISTTALAWLFFEDPALKLTLLSKLANASSAQLATPKTILRVHGSNTIGSKLLPVLAADFLKLAGYKNIHDVKGANEDELMVVGEHDGIPEQIEIHAHGSGTAFNDMKTDLTDIGMSSRKIKPEEQQNLIASLGDLTANGSENVIALDGIAVIVHPSNPVKSLSITQVADIFSGFVTDWAQVGGKPGTIALMARDEKSGTYDFFRDGVLKSHNKTIAANALRFEDSSTLSNVVNENPNSIGFIGLSYIGANKALAISDTDISARKPSLLTIKTEDYLLTRRLYLYASEKSTNPYVNKFIEYAVSSNAQPLISSTGLVNLDITPVAIDANDVRNQSQQWRKLTQNATEIATRFRFHADGNELDSRANRDIGRIVYLLGHSLYQGKKVILIGFADGSGSPKRNLELSQKRVNMVKQALIEEGISVSEAKGIGAEAFVAPNDTDEHKEKNRRVEIWVK